VIATGSQPRRPPVQGLDRVTVWTNREATTVRDIPARVLLVGGSAVRPPWPSAPASPSIPCSTMSPSTTYTEAYLTALERLPL
jgi:hypothetical protein